ncbi:M20/M25/M40 family metallo-hydrolase [Mycolicibacterium austroafricanum]|uniref:M28 family metallopeptidase n=1 Tax=Mycolicibacterium austroafricanum TaxID=39687 RepID=A0ABT8HE77_MYCAO|nr:M28 family metallopeptidase [Mycolicibacterium austroafricanum]MDN4519068.1 M28 family metallopeptidase [Mycolicibacterium austroafricanum]QRZ07439.1 M20/M25/M40 family metallo-hydrolase [Mycolicibacterium austroafricanum]QZT69103.1 M20/M25/M40 family metallo-hydrolase [Mycolicibacterium austroafricanum]
MTSRRSGLGALVAVCALVVSCSSGLQAPVAELGPELADKVTIDGVYGHLGKFQEIADANDGNRADGSPGYQASVDYVAQLLRDKGFDVQTPEFQRLSGSEGGKPSLTVAGRQFRVDQASLLLTTPPGGLKAITLRPRRPAGCTAADYGDVSVAKAIAVVDDAGCSIVTKQRVAVAEGAVGMLVVSQASPSRPVGAAPTLFSPGYYHDLTVPVGVIDPAADAALRRTESPVTLVLDNRPVMTTSRNVVAQTRTGDARNVVMVGAHLDSVRSGPGINDNGSGVATVLETAVQLGGEPQTANAVRFTFWGAEEVSMDGSKTYLRSLSKEQLDDIALYLNFDMVGSPNPGYFTDDGDQSTQTGPVAPVPDGSAGIERTLAARLNTAGVRPADMPLTRTTDYGPFLAAGIPVGGLTTGSSQLKTEVQARLWGGQAGVAFDPNYHTPRDDIDNVDRGALAIMASSAAFAIGTYAQSIDGVNGVPARDERDRSAP